MKMTQVLLLAVCAGLGGAACRANLAHQQSEYPYAIPVELTQVWMKLNETPLPPPDAVVLDEVRGTADRLMEGGSYVASGHYKLSSLKEAQLYLGLTDGRIEGDCTRFVSRGEGTFRIPFRIIATGKLHVTFYTIRADGGDVVTTAYYQEPTHAH